MNIAYIVPSLAAKGPVIVVRDLSELMVANGHKCVVFYFDDIVEMVFSCPTIRIRENIDITKFDIVHSHGLRPDRYVYKHREWGGRVKYISTVHNYVLQDFMYQYNWLVAQIVGRLWVRMLKRMDRVVALTNDAVKYYTRWLPSSKLTYAYNTRIVEQSSILSEEEKKHIDDFKNKSILIGVNALLTHRKGVDQIIKALPFLPNHKLFIAGDGKVKQNLETLAESLGVKDRCYFAGYVKDAYRYVKHYDVYVASSRSEGFPLMLLEAAQYSAPTVCSRIPVFEEIFSPAEVAFFELDNISSLVEAIRNVPNGKEMYERYFNCYTPQKFYKRYMEIYTN